MYSTNGTAIARSQSHSARCTHSKETLWHPVLYGSVYMCLTESDTAVPLFSTRACGFFPCGALNLRCVDDSLDGISVHSNHSLLCFTTILSGKNGFNFYYNMRRKWYHFVRMTRIALEWNTFKFGITSILRQNGLHSNVCTNLLSYCCQFAEKAFNILISSSVKVG